MSKQENNPALKRMATAAALSLAALAATGCGISDLGGPAPIAGPSLHGTVVGGQQPVSNSTLQLYAVSTTGYGAASTPLLTSTVLSDAAGNFSITSKYTCPSASSLVYLVATGGNPTASANANLAMMDALGPCGNLTPSTFVYMNELTTVASVWALSPFMHGIAAIGAPASNATGIANAFDDVNTLADTGRGSTPGPTLPAGATLSAPEMNMLGNILAACVNSSGGVAGDSTPCGTLFTATTNAGPAPTDTITAAMNMAQHPGSNVPVLYGLVTPAAPFQPSLATQPNDYTLAVTYTQGVGAVSALAADSTGNIWLTNKANSSASKLTHTGVPQFTYTGTLAGPSALAVDALDNAWITNATSNTITRLTGSGTLIGAPLSGGGLLAPHSIAFDSQGNAWIANTGSLSEFNSSGTAISGTGGITGTLFPTPAGIAVSPH
jgi:hypothetical protein